MRSLNVQKQPHNRGACTMGECCAGSKNGIENDESEIKCYKQNYV